MPINFLEKGIDFGGNEAGTTINAHTTSIYALKFDALCAAILISQVKQMLTGDQSDLNFLKK